MIQHLYRRRRSRVVIATLFLATNWFRTAVSQAPASLETSSRDQPPAKLGDAMARLHPETTVSVGAAVQLTAPRRTDTPFNTLTTGIAPSAAVVATIRQRFRPALGYSVNFSYSRTNDHYTYSPLPGTTGYTTASNLRVHVYEISIAYLAQQGMTKHLSLFEEVGVGTAAFSTINTGRDLPNRSNAFEPAGVGGIGLEYRLQHGLGLRAQYHGLLTKHPFPDNNGSKLTTVISTPAVSLTYTFGKHGTTKR